jgi:hypothetical protein
MHSGAASIYKYIGLPLHVTNLSPTTMASDDTLSFAIPPHFQPCPPPVTSPLRIHTTSDYDCPNLLCSISLPHDHIDYRILKPCPPDIQRLSLR